MSDTTATYKIFDTLLEPVFVIDAEKRVLYCNEPAALICDLSVRKICRGQVFDQILAFTQIPQFLVSLSEVTEACPYQELSFESTASSRTGKAQLTCQPIAHPDSGKMAWIVFLRDVTLEETLQKKYRAELEQVQHYSKNLEKMVVLNYMLRPVRNRYCLELSRHMLPDICPTAILLIHYVTNESDRAVREFEF